MRLLLLNPNTSVSMTERMVEVARGAAPPGVVIEPATATRGYPYIASRAEAQMAGAVALEDIAARLERDDEPIDAVIVAAFGDPGVKAARELFNVPVIGMAEAAVVTASLLGDRFAIATFTPLMSRWYLDCVHDTGLGSRCTGVRTPARQAIDVASVAERMTDELAALATSCIVDDGADVVILGGAPLAGLARSLERGVPGPLIDPVEVAVRQAAALAATVPSGALRRRHARPAPKSSVHLSPALARASAAGLDASGRGTASRDA